jgi:hypothetical protein
MKSLAVLGSQGCREKNLSTGLSKYATFWGGFLMFSRSKKDFNFFFKIL